MAAMTYFRGHAVPPRRGRARLVAGEAQERQTAVAAERAAAQMAASAAGAVAFARTGSPASGEFEDAEVLRKFGEVSGLSDLLGVR